MVSEPINTSDTICALYCRIGRLPFKWPAIYTFEIGVEWAAVYWNQAARSVFGKNFCLCPWSMGFLCGDPQVAEIGLPPTECIWSNGMLRVYNEISLGRPPHSDADLIPVPSRIRGYMGSRAICFSSELYLFSSFSMQQRLNLIRNCVFGSNYQWVLC
jgi:hypothetical protein